MTTDAVHLFRVVCGRWWIATLLICVGLAWAGDRSALNKDGLHDAANPSLQMLQEPSDTIADLPKDAVGSGVDWNEALEEGVINPRTNIYPETKMRVLNLDIVMRRTGTTPFVRFPHQQHTQWLDCKNCHESLFKAKGGTSPSTNMSTILQGESCGVCHGAVAFPLTECGRCHSEPRR